MALAPRTTKASASDATGSAAAQHVLLRRIVIRCPVTGLPSDTGFELTALPHLVGEQRLIDCLECGQDHSWLVEDAHLE